MARPRNITPTYSLHKQSGRGRLIWTDPTGVRREKLLPAPFGSEESKTAKAQLELLLASGGSIDPVVDASDATVNEVMSCYVQFAEKYYVRADGTPAKELKNMLVAIRPLRQLFGDSLAAEFGPKKLAVVRASMVKRGWWPSPGSQGTVILAVTKLPGVCEEVSLAQCG